MTLESLIESIRRQPGAVRFDEVIATIDASYRYRPTRFTNGDIDNAEGHNEGSCKVFAFAHLNGLTPDETLNCFGEHFRAVLGDPDGDSHPNIRQFMRTGWEGIQYFGTPLIPLTGGGRR